MSEGATLGKRALAQVQSVVRQVLSTFQNPEGHRARYTGATQPCSGTYSFQINFSPAGGTATFTIEYRDVTEQIGVTYDMSPEDLKSAVDAHSQYVANSVESVIVDSTGNLNDGNIILSLPQGSRVQYFAKALTRGSGSPVPEFKIYACR